MSSSPFNLPLQLRQGFVLVPPDDLGYRFMSHRQRVEIDKANVVLYVACARSFIDENHYNGRVLDVGCGHGGSTYVISKNTSKVIACDTREECISTVLQSGIADTAHIFHGRVHDFLKQSQVNSLDMITCFGLDPYFVLHPKEMVNFYNGSLAALSSTGRMIIQSDVRTMASVQHIIPGRFRRFGYQTPCDFLVFSKSEIFQ